MSRLTPFCRSGAVFMVLLAICGRSTAVGVVDEALAGVWDPNRYIGIDEVRPGMDAYCLTEFGPAGIERFALEVIDVVRAFEPGRDVILVKGMDDRFMHTGPVAGCSGSPVYIDGRLAGALALAWPSSKDPLYGVTIIGDMLRVGLEKGVSEASGGGGGAESALDFRQPLNFARIAEQMASGMRRDPVSTGGFSRLPIPVTTSGLSAAGCEELEKLLGPLGLDVVAGVGGGTLAEEGIEAKMTPGSCLMIPLVSGDISISVQGTVTEVRGDEIYGFGHSFLGFGELDLPIATGRVHTVVSHLVRSFKLASTGEIVGALTGDESTAVFGRLGGRATTFPMTISVDRYNDIRPRVYRCRVVGDRTLVSGLVRSAISGAALQLGDLPPEHTIEYSASIGFEGGRKVAFSNVSTGAGLSEIVMEVSGVIGTVTNNPYEEIGIESLDLEIRMTPTSHVSRLWSVELSDTSVKAGQSVAVEAIVESVLAGKKKYEFEVTIPKDLGVGRYNLTVCGAYGYEQHLVKSAPHRLVAQSVPGMFKALNDLLSFDRGKLYCLLSLPSDGVTVETAELPGLPASKALVMQSGKRTITTLPYRRWQEQSIDMAAVVMDRSVHQITVER